MCSVVKDVPIIKSELIVTMNWVQVETPYYQSFWK